MTTTITLTPTLALTVAGSRRLPHSSVEAVWAAINQHTRATGTPGTVDVVDGSQTVRRWVVSPRGQRHQLDDPGTGPADFVLSLSPWNMSIPREDGPTTKEVSTLAVAREQAHAAAAAGKTDIILQVIGTDHDTAETITPLETSPDATDPDAEDDVPLDEFLVTDEDQEAQDPKAKRRRRMLILGGTGAGLFLVACLGAGLWASTVPVGSGGIPAAAAPSATAGTPDTSVSPLPITPTAQAPLGFNVSPAWTIIGATDQVSGLTWSGDHAAAVSGRTLNVLNTTTGEIQATETLPASITSGPMPLADPGTSGGLLMANSSSIFTWAQAPGLRETKIPEGQRLVVRGNTAFLVPHSQSTTPSSIEVITTNGKKTFKSPGSAASPIGPTGNDHFLWASNVDGGSLIQADRGGNSTRTTRLIGPRSGTTITRWIGATDDFVAVIWANDGTGSVLAIHDAHNGKVISTQGLGTTGAGSTMRVVPSADGNDVLAGTTHIDLANGKIVGTVQGISSTRTAVTTVPGAWKATNPEGRSILIRDDGTTVTAPNSDEALLGFTDDRSVIVDHRGTLARFDPESQDPEQP